MFFEYPPDNSDNVPEYVSKYIERIYFGPKASGFEFFRSMLKYKGLDKIECKKSKNPLA